MRVVSEQEIRDLRRKRNVKTAEGERLKPALFHKKPKTPLTAEERSAQSLEKLVSEITLILQANDKNAIILLEMIRRIRVEPARIPERSKPTQKWEHTPIRGGDGKIKKIISEAI